MLAVIGIVTIIVIVVIVIVIVTVIIIIINFHFLNAAHMAGDVVIIFNISPILVTIRKIELKMSLL